VDILRDSHLYEYKTRTPRELVPEVGTLEDFDEGSRVHQCDCVNCMNPTPRS